MARADLSDFDQGLVQLLLPNKPRGVARVKDRRALNSIFRVLPTGSPWRVLPGAPGRADHGLQPLQRVAKGGVWVRAFETLAARSPDGLVLIDSSIISVHQQAAKRRRGRTAPSVVLVED